MGHFNIFAKLATMMDQSKHSPAWAPSKKELKKLRPPRYKPAFTMGFRGFPKTESPCGTVKAPTQNQVRRLERKYETRLHVKASGTTGLLFFAADGVMFSKPEALRRQAHGTV